MGLPTQQENFLGDGARRGAWSRLFTADPRVTVNSGWSTTGSTYTIAGQFWGNTTTTNTIDFTPAVSVDTCKIIYVTTVAGGSISWAVDGGGATTLSETGAQAITSTTISLGSVGAHTIHIARVSGNAYLIGEDCYNSNVKSVRLWDAGASGLTAYNVAGVHQGWSDATYPWSLGSALGTAPVAPNLCIIDLGINDAALAVGLANFSNGLQSVITNCKKSGDVVLVLPFPTATGTTSQATQNAYWAVVSQLATTNNLPVIDWRDYVISSAAATGNGLAGGNYHPTAAGYADFAALVARALNRAAGP